MKFSLKSGEWSRKYEMMRKERMGFAILARPGAT
jgi:hypothetical protein